MQLGSEKELKKQNWLAYELKLEDHTFADTMIGGSTTPSSGIAIGLIIHQCGASKRLAVISSANGMAAACGLAIAVPSGLTDTSNINHCHCYTEEVFSCHSRINRHEYMAHTEMHADKPSTCACMHTSLDAFGCIRDKSSVGHVAATRVEATVHRHHILSCTSGSRRW